MLDDGPHGWQVASLVPVDLAMDRHTHPVRGFALAGAAKRAAKRFAVAYATYKAGAGSEPVKLMTSAAAAGDHQRPGLTRRPGAAAPGRGP